VIAPYLKVPLLHILRRTNHALLWRTCLTSLVLHSYTQSM
jgi:hypothetical protein